MQNLAELEEIYLENCKLRVIEANAFSSLHSLTFLKLSQNNINASMLEPAFYGLRKAINFSELHLEGANLSDHSETTFRLLANTSLTNLSMKATHIQILRSRTFKDLPKLQYLYLKGNALQGIQESAFQNLNALIELDLSDNKLAFVPNAIDVELGCLKTLILTRNSIGIELNPQYFQGYNKLETLNLNGNNIRLLNPSTFMYLPNLKTLLMSGNQIKTIKQGAFARLKKLQLLDMQQNSIVHFPIDMFDTLPALEDLELSNNNYITTEHENDFVDLFRSLRNLARLQMREINLNKLPEYAFYNLTKLSLLSLSGNVVSKWQSNLFRDQQNLKTLNMAKNKLSFIDDKALIPLKSIRTLDLSDNMFNCDCQLLSFTEWIQTGHVYLKNLDSTTCKSPGSKAGRQLQNLQMEKDCMSLVTYYVYWFMLFSNVTIMTTVTTIYRYRWYLK